MAFHDCDVEEADILEVQSVSDMFSAFKTPAADAVKLIGGDDIAVFSPHLGLMVVTSQYDLEEPATTSQTVILSLADAECTWPDPPEYISDIVFECRWPSGANLVTEFQTFSDENATPSPSLEHYRERFSEGGICTVFSECDEAYLLDLKGKRDASRVDNQDRIPFHVARDGGPGRIKRRCAARRRRPLKAQLKEKRLLAATSEAVFPVNGLFDDLDGIGDGKPSALLSIDTAVDERFRFRDGRDKLVERAPAKQAFG